MSSRIPSFWPKLLPLPSKRQRLDKNSRREGKGAYLQLHVCPGPCCWLFQELTPYRGLTEDHNGLKNIHPTTDYIDRLDGGQDVHGGPGEAEHTFQG